MSTVLLIDDEKHLLFALQVTMERAGYEVLAASNGDEGLRLAKQYHPDIIICDVVMPPPDGFALRGLISADREIADIPFIFLTARTGHDDILKGLNLGGDDYITKPFGSEELVARVEAILRRIEKGKQQGLADLERKIKKVRDEIIHNYSHELRTPLACIMGSLGLAMDEGFGDEAERFDLLVEAMKHTHHLKRLVDDIIFLYDRKGNQTDIFRQRMNVETDFLPLVRNVAQQWEKKGIDMRIYVAPNVVADVPYNAFHHAVRHLLDNACKFGPEKGKVMVDLAANGIGGCVLTITDEGPGIPSELREKVFDVFFQVHQGATRPYGGLGVGLTIARDIARSLGGDVEILDSDTGCIVRMTIGPGMREESSTALAEQLGGDF